MAEAVKELTPAGNLKKPSYETVAKWVRDSWNAVDPGDEVEMPSDKHGNDEKGETDGEYVGREKDDEGEYEREEDDEVEYEGKEDDESEGEYEGEEVEEEEYEEEEDEKGEYEREEDEEREYEGEEDGYDDEYHSHYEQEINYVNI
ncbi:hypothetical protein C1646_764720 [Rhizophagus diaphanus]|nr:hypothetical protein C1646_764720 [Rhizophagus diaphanus] [Rhizophagus sp. MUCL 43196]